MQFFYPLLLEYIYQKSDSTALKGEKMFPTWDI